MDNKRKRQLAGIGFILNYVFIIAMQMISNNIMYNVNQQDGVSSGSSGLGLIYLFMLFGLLLISIGDFAASSILILIGAGYQVFRSVVSICLYIYRYQSMGMADTNKLFAQREFCGLLGEIFALICWGIFLLAAIMKKHAKILGITAMISYMISEATGIFGNYITYIMYKMDNDIADSSINVSILISVVSCIVSMILISFAIIMTCFVFQAGGFNKKERDKSRRYGDNAAQVVRCPRCGAYVKDAEYCSNCGAKLNN